MKRDRLLKKADLLLIGGLLLAIGVLLLVLYAPGRHAGETVRVEINGEPADEFPLAVDTVRSYEDGAGGVNVVTVAKGRVFVSEANCPSQICVRHRAISRSGESIVCLPHKLVVTVVGRDANGVDAVA